MKAKRDGRGGGSTRSRGSKHQDFPLIAEMWEALIDPKAWAERRGRSVEENEIKLLILHALAEQQGSGYEVVDRLRVLIGNAHPVASAQTVYPTLALLEDTGYISSVIQEGRRVYAITANGRKWLEQNQGTVAAILDRLRQFNPTNHPKENIADLIEELRRTANTPGSADRKDKIRKILIDALAEIAALHGR